MILLTVGSQLPFDRLVRAVDAWCADTARADVFGQIADPGPSGYTPTCFEWQPFVSPTAFNDFANRAELIVAHAGMGSIISALTFAKPIVIMPRRGALGEHRNDHQLATARRFADRAGIFAAFDETALAETIERALQGEHASGLEKLSRQAHPELTDAIRRFILQ